MLVLIGNSITSLFRNKLYFLDVINSYYEFDTTEANLFINKHLLIKSQEEKNINTENK